MHVIVSDIACSRDFGGSPGRSTEHATLLTHKGALEAAPEESQRVLKEMFAFWDNVNSEDIDICEKVQVGTGAEPHAGWFQSGRPPPRVRTPPHRPPWTI